MQITMKFARSIVISVLALTPLLSHGQSAATPPGALSGLKPPPQLPASNTLLQSALNDLNNCIANSLSTATAAQKSITADAAMSQCATQQAKLKQMLPPDAYNAGVANTQQYVSKVLATQTTAQ